MASKSNHHRDEHGRQTNRFRFGYVGLIEVHSHESGDFRVVRLRGYDRYEFPVYDTLSRHPTKEAARLRLASLT